jgi:SAM-dependent methyltransferase
MLNEQAMSVSTTARVRAAVSQHIQTTKMSWRIRQFGSPTLSSVYGQILAGVDRARLDRLRQETLPAFHNDPVSAAKYADHRFWLLLNIRRAAELGLHSSKSKRILDIGCGPGFFMAVTRALGHECKGVDVPETYFTDIERKVYAELLQVFGNRGHVSPLLIERFTPLPFAPASFDLITAYWICFNRHRQPDIWGPEEWRYFVDDAKKSLRPGGQLYLELNENIPQFGEMCFYNTAILDFFQSVGQVDGPRIVIPA